MRSAWTKSEVEKTRAAAATGDAAAQRKLATILAVGGAGPPNYLEAFKWYRKASESGDAEAQYNLAIMYLRGEGTRKHPANGLRWLRAAARNGSEIAEEVLGQIYEQGAFGFRANKSAAVRWYAAAARHGNPKAKLSLGMLYLARPSAADRVKALSLLKDAARAGITDAQRAVRKLAGESATRRRKPAAR